MPASEPLGLWHLEGDESARDLEFPRPRVRTRRIPPRRKRAEYDASPLWRAVVLHRGDEEFPAEVNLLFSDRIAAFLPLEDVAVLAGLVATRLTRAAQESGR